MAPKYIEDAVKKAQTYFGSYSWAPLEQQQRFFKAMNKAIESVAKKLDMNPQNVYDQITNEAKSRGPIRPMPSKDY